MPLADTQRAVRDALVTGATDRAIRLIDDGVDRRARLVIHQRHYQTSLVRALVARFPATEWLVGTEALADVAREFVRRHPPSAPCLAEYGAALPALLGDAPVATRAPYGRAFAELEWHLGVATLAVDQPALTIDALAGPDGDRVADIRLALQPGVAYLQAAWPIDTLLTLYLTGTAPATLTMDPLDVWLEVRGARGDCRVTRLSPGDWRFRLAIQSGFTLGRAAELAFTRDAAFDPGAALQAVFAAGLAAAIWPTPSEETIS